MGPIFVVVAVCSATPRDEVIFAMYDSIDVSSICSLSIWGTDSMIACPVNITSGVILFEGLKYDLIGFAVLEQRSATMTILRQVQLQVNKSDRMSTFRSCRSIDNTNLKWKI